MEYRRLHLFPGQALEETLQGSGKETCEHFAQAFLRQAVRGPAGGKGFLGNASLLRGEPSHTVGVTRSGALKGSMDPASEIQ